VNEQSNVYIAGRSEYEAHQTDLTLKTGMAAPTWGELIAAGAVEGDQVGIVMQPDMGIIRFVCPSEIRSGKFAEVPTHGAVAPVEKAIEALRMVRDMTPEYEAMVRAFAVDGEVGLLFYEDVTSVASPGYVRALTAVSA
jgi:hypothetical protein